MRCPFRSPPSFGKELLVRFAEVNIILILFASSGHPEDHLDETMNQLAQITHQIQEARLTLRGQVNEAEALASQTRSQIEPYADDESLAVKLAGQEQQGWMEAAVSTIPAADKTYDVEKLASDTAWLIKRPKPRSHHRAMPYGSVQGTAEPLHMPAGAYETERRA